MSLMLRRLELQENDVEGVHAVIANGTSHFQKEAFMTAESWPNGFVCWCPCSYNNNPPPGLYLVIRHQRTLVVHQHTKIFTLKYNRADRFVESRNLWSAACAYYVNQWRNVCTTEYWSSLKNMGVLMRNAFHHTQVRTANPRTMSCPLAERSGLHGQQRGWTTSGSLMSNPEPCVFYNEDQRKIIHCFNKATTCKRPRLFDDFWKYTFLGQLIRIIFISHIFTQCNWGIGLLPEYRSAH